MLVFSVTRSQAKRLADGNYNEKCRINIVRRRDLEKSALVKPSSRPIQKRKSTANFDFEAGPSSVDMTKVRSILKTPSDKPRGIYGRRKSVTFRNDVAFEAAAVDQPVIPVVANDVNATYEVQQPENEETNIENAMVALMAIQPDLRNYVGFEAVANDVNATNIEIEPVLFDFGQSSDQDVVTDGEITAESGEIEADRDGIVANNQIDGLLGGDLLFGFDQSNNEIAAMIDQVEAASGGVQANENSMDDFDPLQQMVIPTSTVSNLDLLNSLDWTTPRRTRRMSVATKIVMNVLAGRPNGIIRTYLPSNNRQIDENDNIESRQNGFQPTAIANVSINEADQAPQDNFTVVMNEADWPFGALSYDSE